MLAFLADQDLRVKTGVFIHRDDNQRGHYPAGTVHLGTGELNGGAVLIDRCYLTIYPDGTFEVPGGIGENSVVFPANQEPI